MIDLIGERSCPARVDADNIDYMPMQSINSDKQKKFILCLVPLTLLLSCAKPSDDTPSAGSGRYLYVASGACYSGNGITTFTNTTSSNLVYRIDTSSGLRDAVVADYNQSPAQAGDTPVGVVDIDSNYVYVLIENTTTPGARRVEKVEKKASGARSTFSNNTTAMSAQLRGMKLLSTGDLLISKSSAIEKITAANVRITQGANPFVNAPAAPCATSTTLMTKVLTMSSGNLFFLHAATSQNRFGIVSASGYAAAADCKSAQSSPNASSFPVAAVYDAVNTKLIVAYGGSATTTDINSIYAYSINESTNAISSPQKIYDVSLYPATYPYLLYGITEMTLDSQTNTLYVATAINTSTTAINYAIEKFTYDATKIGSANASVLTRVGSTPFYPYGSDTKCISSMFVGN
ncbi:MAG: hypothetical protein KF865_11295 [Bdellovibrionaceae bacterium]|nr:hypothetical protein [Pseudobdellovibrionaceae bacterium]